MADAGLVYSTNAGNDWETDSDLSARQITNLFSSASHDLFAFGATEGLWHSDDNGQSWGVIGDFESLLMTAANDSESGCLLAATAQGVLRAAPPNLDWQLVLPVPDVTAILFSKTFAQDQRVWVGTWSGDYFVSLDGGFHWQMIAPPPTPMPVVRLGLIHSPTEPEQFISITFQPTTHTLTLWRITEGRWQIWLESRADFPTAHIAEAPSNTEDVIVSLGSQCWRWVSGAWDCILKLENPILRLLRHPKGELVALTADSLLYSADLVNWAILNTSENAAFNDLALVPDDAERVAVHILTRGGGLLYGTIPE